VRYRFHPLVGERLAVIRLHYVNDEPCYVIRRPNRLLKYRRHASSRWAADALI
jgi:hypothetical protein